MKYGSYIASGYKYGLLSFPEDVLGKSTIDTLFKDSNQGVPRHWRETSIKINSRDCDKIVPFEHVDGLQLSDLTNYSQLLYDNKYYMFIMYDVLPLCLKTVDFYGIEEITTPKNVGCLRYIFLINRDYYKDSTIDEVIEEHLITNLDKINLGNRRRALGFLEDYIGNGQIETNIIINDYLHRHSSKYSDIINPLPTYAKLPDRLIKK